MGEQGQRGAGLYYYVRANSPADHEAVCSTGILLASEPVLRWFI